MNADKGGESQASRDSDDSAWHYECEWTAEASAEADFHLRYRNCKKNPGHQSFIPIDELNIDHLPPDYRDEDILELIKLIAALTVKIRVSYVSMDRPETFPDTQLGQHVPDFKKMVGEPFPFFQYRGSSVLRTGTACVRHVQNFKDQCLCGVNCPFKYCGRILIYTARHVVFDASEAKKTEFLFYYDSESHAGRLERARDVFLCSTEEDWCLMDFFSHDVEFVDKLQNTLERMEALSEKLDKKYASSERVGGPGSNSPLESGFPAFIVSHPHGCSKMVTLGRCTGVNEGVEDEDKFLHVVYNYSAQTCPGSSGAMVFIVDSSWRWEWRGLSLLRNVLHSACLDGDLNRSAAAFWSRS